MAAADADLDPSARAVRRRNRWYALTIIGAFVAPILVAFWIAILHPQVLSQHRLNHGLLLTPPLDLADVPALLTLAQFPFKPGEWGMLYYAAGACAEDCAKAVARLADIRELSGQDGTRVHVIALVDAAARPIARATTVVEHEARSELARAVAVRTGVGGDAAIVLLDGRGFLVMAFPPDAPSADIKADLKRLLRASATH